jgi:hypothetical protein
MHSDLAEVMDEPQRRPDTASETASETASDNASDLAPTPDRPASIEPSPAVSQLHRAVSLLAVISLFIGTLTSFDALIWTHPGGGAMLVLGYALALALAIAVVVVRARHTMLIVDIGILCASVIVRLPDFIFSFPRSGLAYKNDEGALIDFGGGLLRHGVDPYSTVWAAAHAPAQLGITQTLSGGVIDHYDYPPIPAIWSYLVNLVAPSMPQAAIAAAISLLAATILLFVLLPAPWKSAASMLCIGLGIYLVPFARQGYPEIMALPFLIVAVNRWNRIGIGGRLGRFGVISAVCLGIATSTQQLAWFLAPFLIVGILLCRLGDQDRRTAWFLTARYCLIAVGVFAAINAPFAVAGFHAWSAAIFAPVTVALVPHGQGLVAIIYYLVNGSGGLQYLSYASAAFAIGLLAVFALFIRRLGTAMSILPWTIFFLSIRSSDKYFYVMMPLWLICLATVRQRDMARARAPGLRLGRFGLLTTPIGRITVTAALLAPATILAVMAITAPPPLSMTIQGVTATKTAMTSTITVKVSNTSTQSISPHFALSDSQSMSRFWLAAGPATVPAGQSAVFVLTPSTPGSRRSLDGPRILLRATSDHPETLSSVALRMQTPTGS